ncbi:MAG: cellulase family glycosylhydrolase, partial [Candidatus Latescibacteria bacterium]|nr:cellulase family glycosylhydrolase [Candidatus Latescibacterota bacterium]
MSTNRLSEPALALIAIVLAAPLAETHASDPTLQVSGNRIVNRSAHAADYDSSGVVDFTDFVVFARAFGTDDAGRDLTGDGTVGFADFVAFSDAFGLQVDVVLRGVATVDPYFLHRRERVSRSDFAVLARDWNAGIVRLPVHPDLWQLSDRYLEDYVDPIVAWCEELGIYVFLGWHAHGSPITGQAEKPDWAQTPPWRGNPYNPDRALAISALTEMAARYADRPRVIFGTFNEPAYVGWDEWRPVAEELVDTIHSAAPDALVMVSGTDFGYDLNGVLDNPVDRPNVVYETHPYPWKGEAWKTFVPALSRRHPVFLGEWGYGPTESPGFGRLNYGEPLVALCRGLGIGWTAW